jgi:hypothetical protein
MPVIRQILEDDGKAPTKQKHTARRIIIASRASCAACFVRESCIAHSLERTAANTSRPLKEYAGLFSRI